METSQLNKFVELATMFDTFKFIPRLSTKRIPIEFKESVAIHIYEMQYLAYLAYYSMEEEDRNSIDLLKVFKLILWHEADESVTNDIPYPAKHEIKRTGNGMILCKLKSIVYDLYTKIIPDRVKELDKDTIYNTFDIVDSPEKRFAKFLDYVNLYLNSIKLCQSGYSMNKTVEECKKLTENHEFYSKCPLVRHLIENPELFVNSENN